MKIDGVEFVDLSRSPLALRQALFLLFGTEVRVRWQGPMEISGQGILTSTKVEVVGSDEDSEEGTMFVSLGLEASDFTPGMEATFSVSMNKDSFTIYLSDAMGIWLSANSGDLAINPVSPGTVPNMGH